MGYFNDEGYEGLGDLSCGPDCGCQSRSNTVAGLGQSYERDDGDAPAAGGALRGYGFAEFGQPAPPPRPPAPPPRPPAPSQAAAATPLTLVANAAVPPWRAICRIVARDYDGKGYAVGSGVLIAPFHVLTCAHVIFPPQAPRTREITVYVGQSGASASGTGIKSNGWAVSPGWRNNDCTAAGEDFGIVRLPVKHGFIPLIPFNPADLLSVLVTMAGHPASRSPDGRDMFFSRGNVLGGIVVQSCTAESMTGRLVPTIPVNSNLVGHDLQSEPSMSGGPMWFMKDTRRLAAIHAGTVAGGRIRKAIVMNDRVRAQIRQMMQQALPPMP